MKIELITLHNAKNYGSILQTYATQNIFKNLGCDVEVINYSRESLKDENLVDVLINSSSMFSKNALTKMVGKLFLVPSVKKECKVFNGFLKENINLSKKYENFEELEKNPPIADIYCTGSDQVWNSDWNRGIEKAYFLDFINNKKKISYASSIGKDKLLEEEKGITKELLEKYEHISVREQSAVKIIKDLGINDVELVLDPTLMLNKQEWKKLEVKLPIKQKYILVYQLNTKNPEFDEYVKKLSKEKKMPVVRVSVALYQILKYGKFKFCPTVNEFVSYFLNAEYVVTDSFHATAFAINFNKKFVSIFPNKFSTRLQNILDITGLQNRRLTDPNNLKLIDEDINYEEVNKIMENARGKSMEYLKKAIK